MNSIGIIGGSDGPTAVITASAGTNWPIYGLILLLFAGILFLILRRKKK